MDINKINKKILFVLLFGILALIGLNVNLAQLWGADNQFFTLFQFLGPIAGVFLGPLYGAISVVLAETANFFVIGREFTLINIFRILPMVFAAIYFGTKRKEIGIVVPLIAMAIFLAHPIGREVWFFALFWTIPIIARLIPENLFTRSLGTTFTAHAVGASYWIWFTNMEANLWVALIPVVIFERLMFASGIAVSYVGMNALLSKIAHKIPEKVLFINPAYLPKALFKQKA